MGTFGARVAGLGLAAAVALALGWHAAGRPPPSPRPGAPEAATHLGRYPSRAAARAADRRAEALARRPRRGGALRSWHRGAVWYASEAVAGAECAVAAGSASGRAAFFAVVAGRDTSCRPEAERAARLVAALARRAR